MKNKKSISKIKNREKNRENYKIGKGKPPKKSQFKKGQSGNPKGAPKRKHWATLTRELIEDDARKKIIKVWQKEAIGGNLKAIEMLCDREDGKPKQTTVLDIDPDGVGEVILVD